CCLPLQEVACPKMGRNQLLYPLSQGGVVAARLGDVRVPFLRGCSLDGTAEDGIQARCLGGHGRTPRRMCSTRQCEFSGGKGSRKPKAQPGAPSSGPARAS